MEMYDVIIIGGGPAGLLCAETLSGSDLSVLLIEKDRVFGDKVCAGGITSNDIKILSLPEELFEHKISSTRLCSVLNMSYTKAGRPFLYTVDRRQLGEWQRGRINGKNIKVVTGSKVTRIENDRVEVDGSQKIGYRYLVGADGYASTVRKFLGLPTKARLIGLQYQVPVSGDDPRFEIHLHAYYFGAWYGWIFPHRKTLAVGCVADPRFVNPKKLKDKFHRWLKKMDIDISKANYESAPIGCDYRGWQFGNIFLAGDAGGFASWLTGEGIYQALVSGKAIAERILDRGDHSEELEKVIRYNRVQKKFLKVFIYAGPLRYLLHELLILLMKSPFIKKKVSGTFTEPPTH